MVWWRIYLAWLGSSGPLEPVSDMFSFLVIIFTPLWTSCTLPAVGLSRMAMFHIAGCNVSDWFEELSVNLQRIT